LKPVPKILFSTQRKHLHALQGKPENGMGDLSSLREKARWGGSGVSDSGARSDTFIISRACFHPLPEEDQEKPVSNKEMSPLKREKGRVAARPPRRKKAEEEGLFGRRSKSRAIESEGEEREVL